MSETDAKTAPENKEGTLMTSTAGEFLSEDNGATLFCDTCDQQVRSNEAHVCHGRQPKAVGIPPSLMPLPRWKRMREAEVERLKKRELQDYFLGLQTHAQKLQSQLDAQPEHSLRLEELLKGWIVSFNKLGIGVWFEPSKSPTVKFAKDSVVVHVHYDHLLRLGMYTILQMFHPLPNSRVVPMNRIEGTHVTEEWQPGGEEG